MISDSDCQKHHEFPLIGREEFPLDEVEIRLLGEFSEGPEVDELRSALKNKEYGANVSLALLRAFEILLPKKLGKTTPQTIGLRAVCLLWMMQSGKMEIGIATLSHLAETFGVTRSILSYHVRGFERSLGFHARQQMPSGSVESNRKAAKLAWKNKH